MKVSGKTITALVGLITGDERLSPYRSGPKLVRLFNEHGFNDSYGPGFPSRGSYTEGHLRELNEKPELAALICEVLDPRGFMDTAFNLHEATDFLNKRLRFDGLEIVFEKDLPRVRHLNGSAVELKHPFQGSAKDGHIFIDEQIQKAEDKIRDGDYDGAITNARSLLEGCLTEIEKQVCFEPDDYNGDLPALFKRVQKELALDPARPDVDTPLKQVLSGLASIVSGLAGMSNKLGDRHARQYKPARRHAVLTVNAAKTLSSFVFETMESRKTKKV